MCLWKQTKVTNDILGQNIKTNTNLKIKIVAICLIINLLLLGCSTNQPPLEFAPNSYIIEKALVFTLEKKYIKISKQLNNSPPKLQLNKININEIIPIVKFNLPTYHLKGNYQATLTLKDNSSRKINNSFTLDLQRRKKGQTWILLLEDNQFNQKKYLRQEIW